MSGFFNAVLGVFLKLLILAFAVVFGVGLIAAALLYLVWSGLVFLVTGRKPVVAVLFSQVRRFKEFSTAGGVWPRPAGRAPVDQPASPDVVDVEVREIRSEPGQPGGEHRPPGR
ncbi:MAG: hypothetical protein LH479_02175 [Polaromonas sp.]|nr:hypothetical protein [Polaromonas sp.]